MCVAYVCVCVCMREGGAAEEGNVIDINSCGRNAKINVGDLNSSG